MKKIIAISVMFALVAGAVFADVSLGGSFGYKWNVLKGTNGKTYPKFGYLFDTSDADPTKWTTSAQYVPLAGDTKGETALGYATPVRSGTELDSGDNNINFNFSGDNYGGRVRVYATAEQGWWGANPFAFAWWKPVDVFKFQLGHNPDADWGAAQITGWGFNGGAQNYVAIDNDGGNGSTSWIERKGTEAGQAVSDPTHPTWEEKSRNRAWRAARSYGFYPGYSEVGALFSIYPVDILTVNIALPANAGHSTGTVDAEDMFKKAHLNVVAKVGDIGTARLSFVGKGGTKTSKIATENTAGDAVIGSSKSYNSTGDIWASFYLTAIEGLGVDLGFGYHLPYDKKDDKGVVTSTENGGVEVGLGVRYTVSDDLGVKVRLGALLMNGTKTPAKGGVAATSKERTNYGIGILPYYNLGSLTAYFNAGFGIDTTTETKKAVITYTDWFVNPYVKVPAGGLTFWAGLKVIGDTMIGHSTKTAYQNGGTMEWALPIGISVGF